MDRTAKAATDGLTREFSPRPKFRRKADADLAGIITNGKGKMPKYGEQIERDEIKDLVTYIRGLSKK